MCPLYTCTTFKVIQKLYDQHLFLIVTIYSMYHYFSLNLIISNICAFFVVSMVNSNWSHTLVILLQDMIDVLNSFWSFTIVSLLYCHQHWVCVCVCVVILPFYISKDNSNYISCRCCYGNDNDGWLQLEFELLLWCFFPSLIHAHVLVLFVLCTCILH